MKTVIVLFNSLNRRALGAYGGSTVATPNFDRLAARTQVYDNHYVGSMPCMPARRDMMTGRLSFLHRSWGPLEPFDNAWPEILRAEKGTHSHLITDHYHYWEDGGATYHNRYSTFDFIRGQESDPWKAVVAPDWESLRARYHPRQCSVGDLISKHAANVVNREYIRDEADFPAVQTFDKAMEFLDTNAKADNWVLQVETFDPHEPFTAPDRFREAFPTGWNGPIRDWPRYGRVDETEAEADELRANYHALVAMCDEQMGRVLDRFDALDLWQDTCLIVTTDHGFLLGEHDFWAKNRMTIYQEIAHIPLMIHDPRTPGTGRVEQLTQNMDLMPSLLELYGCAVPKEVLAKSLFQPNDRQAVLFGYFGGAVNVTDGQHSYHRYPIDLATQKIFQYTLMPTHIISRFSTEELAQATLAPPMAWTKGVPLLKVPVLHTSPMYNNYGPGCLLENETRLYDLTTDPAQETHARNPALEARMAAHMASLMQAHDAPPEAFERLGL